MSQLKEAYCGKKVLVTGHTGFKGSWLCIWLKKLGAEVVGLSLDIPTEPAMFEICGLENQMISLKGDVRDLKVVSQAIEEHQPEVIFHLAAQALVRQSYKAPVETFETNIMGTIHVLEAARQASCVKAVLVVTTDKCYENQEWVYGYRETDPMGGHDPYSASKGCGELVVSAYRNSYFSNLNKGLSSARAGNVIGGGDWAEDRLIPDFIKAALNHKEMLIRNPRATRPWQHVLEPLSGYLWLAANMLEGTQNFNSGWNFGPKDADVLDVETVMKTTMGLWGSGNLAYDKSHQPHEANLLKLDISKAAAQLKWHPVYDFFKAISLTTDWYKAYYHENDANMFEYTVKQIEAYEREAKTQNLIWSV